MGYNACRMWRRNAVWFGILCCLLLLCTSVRRLLCLSLGPAVQRPLPTPTCPLKQMSLHKHTHTQGVHDCFPSDIQEVSNLNVGLSVQLAPKHSIPAYASSGVANGTMTSLVFYTFCYVFCCDILQSRKRSQTPETFLCLAVCYEICHHENR